MQQVDVLEQLVAVERSPLLVSHRLRLPPEQIRVDRAAFLQDLWTQKSTGDVR